MTAPAASLATWNIEWSKSSSGSAALMRERLLACDPEIVCITEGYTDFFEGSGHLIEAEADFGYGYDAKARKAMLWSKRPWTDVDSIGDPAMPSGRFIAGRTESSIGPIDVVGVCIPWRDAHVRSGRRDRNPWQDHLAYLAGLRRYLQQTRGQTAIIGDFNQRVPRTYAPPAVYEALVDCLEPGFTVATAGPLPPDNIPSIDHIAHSDDLAASDVAMLSNYAPDGKRLSDHFGVSLRLALKG